MAYQTTPVIAIDIDTGWWTYRVHLGGRIQAICPETEWLDVDISDQDDDEISGEELRAIAKVEFEKLGITILPWGTK